MTTLLNGDLPAGAEAQALHLERLNALWKLSIQCGLDDRERIRTMLDMARRVLALDLVVLGQFDTTYHARHVSDGLAVLPEGAELPPDAVPCLTVMQSGCKRFIADISKTPYADPFATQMGLRAYAGFPVHAGDDASRVLAFLSRVPGEPSVIDEAYMALIADWLGNALHQSAQTELLQRIALTDMLTGLPNRRAAEERLQKERARTPRDGHGFAVALVDLDHFKLVNDRYGHAVGDELLKTVAKRFEAGLREGDWVARWGGEEFLFVLHGSTADEAGGIIGRLANHARATPVRTQVGEIPLSFSAGVGAFDPRANDIGGLLEEVDHALYRAKSSGRDRVCLAAHTLGT
ncbi:MAG: sensor domain-containing diguanylate cyclase [Thiobacillus sp.]|nr:sensor domain-containing diguanylate cyclase [Thiobacillus sp.]